MKSFSVSFGISDVTWLVIFATMAHVINAR